ncbi:uncharacterized protein LOC119732053 [Patiria miniata]|uniref:NACHT domain-containing protein n=1 Tax=Patiria miniata TaxID=46514 RepID=A0A914AC93_PATMI|nr:uncharacterized protein LOC119732053 [Patiria miniata]
MTSPEHPRLKCKQVDGPYQPPQNRKQEQEVVEQTCQHCVTVPEKQTVRQERIYETERPQPESGIEDQGFHQVREASPVQLGHEQSSHQGTATCENEGVEQKQASHHAQIPRKYEQKMAGVIKQNIQQSTPTSPEHQRMRQERDDDLYGPDPNIQSTVGEQRPQEEVMTSAQEKLQSDRLHKGNLSPEQLQAVEDLVPSAVQPAMQHPSTLCTHHSSDSIQPTVQTGDVNVPGSCNPVFLGSSSGHTFHYEFNQNVTVHQGATSGEMGNDQRPEVSNPSVQTSQDTSPATDAAAAAAADLCEEALKKVYKTTGSYVQMIPWVDDDMRDIMDIYTKLRLVTDDNEETIGMWYKDGKEVNYEDTFLVENKGYIINRIVYEGLAGLGKTTLIGKIAYDWASGSSGSLAKYKLVFVLRMSALEQSADLLDSLYEQLIDPNVIDKNHLETFIFKNPKKVLILLDGFDELTTTELDNKSFGSILQILNRKVGADIDVVITTRPSHFSALVSKSLVKNPYTRVKVLGFFMQDIKNYVEKFFSKKPCDAEILFQTIISSGVLLDLAHSPMLLLLMCLLWRQDSILPDTTSRLYGEAVRYIFKRKGIPEEEILDILVAVGEIAFNGLVSPVQRLSFQERDFEKSALDKAVKAGILTSQRFLIGLDTHNNIQFTHKTFQEFSAAFYLQSLQKSDTDEFQQNLDKLDDPETFHYLLRFCCGDNEACTIKVLQMLQKRINDESTWIKTTTLNMALNCYFESQADNLLSEAFAQSVITETINTDYLKSRDDVNSFVWFLKHVANEAKYTGNIFLDKVKKLKFSNHSLEGCSKHLAVAMSSMPNVSAVRMRNCCLTTDNMTEIASVLGRTDKLSVLDLSCNSNLSGSVHSWISQLNKTHLRKLKLDGCSLTVDDMRQIALSLSDMPNVMETSWSEYLWIYPKGCGIGLQISNLSLNGTEIKLILKALVNRKDLVALYMAEIKGLQGTAALWASQFKELKQLDQLTFESCTLTSTDVKLITESLCDTPTLTELCLSQNYSKSHIDVVVVDRVQGLGGTAAEWSPALRQLKYLKQLHLQNCFLNVEDVKWIAAAVGCLPRLIHCTVDDVFEVSPCGTGLKIELSNQTFTGSDVAGIVKAMCSRNDIVQVVVEDAKGLRDTAAVWLPALQELKCLERLGFINCSLSGTDIEHIAASLSTNLVHLHVSRNPLAGSGVSLSKLKQLTHLKILTLDDCGLEVEDVISIAAVVGCLPKLRYCRLMNYVNGFNDLLFFEVVPCEIGIGIRLHLPSSKFRGPDVANIVRALGSRRDLVDVTIEYIKNFGGKAAEWSPALQVLEHLKRFRISNSSLIDKDIKHIAASLSDIPTLVELDLSGNVSLAGSSAWSHLKCLKQLEKLKLRWCALRNADLELIAVSLSGKSNLLELDLSGNVSLAGSSAWSHLKCLKQLKNLELQWCALRNADIELIAASLSEKSNLLELDLSGNEYLAGSGALSHLKCMKQLKKLVLQLCWLSDADIKPITASLSDTPTLVELDLSRNVSLAFSGAWYHLKCKKQLRKLVLKECWLSDADIEPITASLRDIPTLVELDLSGHESLAGSSAWSHLKCLKQLKKLKLRWCALRNADFELIAASFSEKSNLLELDLSGNESLAGSGAWSHLKCLKQLKNLELQWCALRNADIELIAASLSEKSNLLELDLSGNEYLAGSGALSHLKCMKQLKKLVLKECWLSDADIKPITASFSDIPTLVELDLSGNVSLACSGAWSHLKCMKQLQKLVLKECWLSDADIEPIAESLSDIPTLVELDLSRNVSLAGSSAWSHLKCLKQLKKLELRWCALRNADIELIAASLSEKSNLLELDLSGNESLAGSGAWSHLKCLKQLKKLVLKECWLSDADIKPIAASLSDIPTLVELDLSKNVSLACSGVWSHLKCLKQLQKLVLKECWLSDADIEPIAVSLSDIPTLVELDLSRNESLAGSSAWSHLKCLKQLEKLKLRWCALRNADLELIAASLSEKSNLLELDLSGNESLAGSGAWSHLKCLKQLKKLVLKECWLSDADIEPITASLSDIPTLVELDLSGNKYMGYSDAWSHLKRLKQLKKLSLRECSLSDADIQLIAASLSSVVVESTTCESEFESESEFELGF